MPMLSIINKELVPSLKKVLRAVVRAASEKDSDEFFCKSSNLKGKKPRVRLAENISALESMFGRLLVDDEDTDSGTVIGAGVETAG